MTPSPTPTRWKKALVCSLLLALCLATGCHSESDFVSASITNRSGAPIRLIEVDYPNASFGTQDLPDGGTFQYRFKIFGRGETKLLWTDGAGKEHASDGPMLEEGGKGSLTITITAAGASWKDAVQRYGV